MAGTPEEPLFCLADVCAVLGIANVAQVAGRLDPDEKGVCQADTPGGPQEMTFVVGRVADQRFGFVHTYPESVLSDYFGGEGGR
jgi:hypothetical protein